MDYYFRVNLVVILAIFSGFLIVELVKMFSKNKPKRWLWLTGLGVVMLITSNGRSTPFTPLEAWEYDSVYHQFYVNDIKKYAAEKQPEKCIALIDAFLTLRPAYLDALNAENRSKTVNENYMGYFFIKIYTMKAKILRGMMRQSEAKEAENRVFELHAALDNGLINTQKEDL